MNPTMKVEAVFTDMLEPYPAEITQNEVQYNALYVWYVLLWFPVLFSCSVLLFCSVLGLLIFRLFWCLNDTVWCCTLLWTIRNRSRYYQSTRSLHLALDTLSMYISISPYTSCHTVAVCLFHSQFCASYMSLTFIHSVSLVSYHAFYLVSYHAFFLTGAVGAVYGEPLFPLPLPHWISKDRCQAGKQR
jgi:hypothetical protein